MNLFPFINTQANLITNSIHAWLTKDYRLSSLLCACSWCGWLTLHDNSAAGLRRSGVGRGHSDGHSASHHSILGQPHRALGLRCVPVNHAEHGTLHLSIDDWIHIRGWWGVAGGTDYQACGGNVCLCNMYSQQQFLEVATPSI